MPSIIGVPPPLAPYMPHRAVLVIVPCFNHAEFLTDCVMSVVEQGCRDWAMVLCDDHSNDDSWNVMAKLACGHPHLDISVTRTPDGRKGQAAARNQCVRIGNSSDWIVQLDADDMLMPGHLAMMLAEVAVDDSEGEICGWYYCDYETFGFGGVGEISPPDDADDLVLERNLVTRGGSFISRSMWEELGGLDETLNGGDDWDMWIRAVKAGHIAGHVQEKLYRYRRHEHRPWDMGEIIRAVERKHGL